MKRENMTRKSPWVAAVLNLLIWGAGYIYNGVRTAYGVGLIVVEILEHAPLFYLGLEATVSFPIMLYPISHLLISVLLAYDGYKDTEKINSQVKRNV